MVMGTIPPPYDIVEALANAGASSFLGINNILRLHFRLQLVCLLLIPN
jgi:hypothetical protein